LFFLSQSQSILGAPLIGGPAIVSRGSPFLVDPRILLRGSFNQWTGPRKLIINVPGM